MTMRLTPWSLVLAAALSGVAMASCTLLAPTGTNSSLQAFPIPDANGIVVITHRRVDSAAERFSFQFEVPEGTASAPAAIEVDSTEEDVAASFNVNNLGFAPGVHRVFIVEGTDPDAPTAAERVFVVPVPVSDGTASPAAT